MNPKSAAARHLARGLVAAAAVAALALGGCTKLKNYDEPAAGPGGAKASESKPTSPPPKDLATRGREVYEAKCTACHNADPRRAGVNGPDVWGSSTELLEARLLRAAYPKGYQPKRKSRAMLAAPELKDLIPALHAYLNAPDT